VRGLKRQPGIVALGPRLKQTDPHVADFGNGHVQGCDFDHPKRPLASTDPDFEDASGWVFTDRPVDETICGGVGKMKEIE
jgi:hypothetical protein